MNRTGVVVRIDTRKIHDWASFHDTFQEAFGFPSFYGRTMDAWIDCMSLLDDPAAGMTTFHAPEGGVVVIQLDDADGFAIRCPEQYAAVVDCAAFVNWRRLERGDPAVVALSYYRSP